MGKDDKYPLLEKDRMGIIFVERRITALVLYSYLQKKYVPKNLKNSDKNISVLGKRPNPDNSTLEEEETPQENHRTIRCDIIARQMTHVFKYLHSNHKLLEVQRREQRSKITRNKLRKKEVFVIEHF